MLVNVNLTNKKLTLRSPALQGLASHRPAAFLCLKHFTALWLPWYGDRNSRFIMRACIVCGVSVGAACSCAVCVRGEAALPAAGKPHSGCCNLRFQSGMIQCC